MFKATEKEVKELRREYPKGTRVVLVRMDDTQAPPVGTKGTVLGVNDTGSLLMAWDNGCGLNVVYGEDEVKKINDSMSEYSLRDILIAFSIKYKGIFTSIYGAIAIKEELSHDEMEELLDKAPKYLVTIIDDDYPSSLKKIPCPPFVLYYCGNLEEINEKEISLFHVGSLKYGHRYFMPSANYPKRFIACENPLEFSSYLNELITIYKDCI